MITNFKLYENVENQVWLVQLFDSNQVLLSTEVCQDEESVENYIINLANDDRKDISENSEEDYTEDMIFIYVDDVIKWYQNSNDIEIMYHPEKVRNDKLDEQIIRLRETRKYNL